MMKGVGMTTDNSATPGIRLPWAGKNVRQEHVEDELMTLWHLAADNMRISQNTNVRTSVLNFVICAPDIASAQQASALLRDLSSMHIARVTILILDSSNTTLQGVSTWVTLRSFPVVSDLMRHHFEQVTVALGSDTSQYAATIVQRLLKPDLPVYLWWLKDLPTDDQIFKSLAHISNRVIVDSNNFSQPKHHLQVLSTVLQTEPDCSISDLNWGRLTTWRELIAQDFDVAEYRAYLIDTEQIEIAYTIASQKPQPLSALLVAAWIKTRLGWQRSTKQSDNNADEGTGIYGWRMTTRDDSQFEFEPDDFEPDDEDAPQAQTAEKEMQESSISVTIQPQTLADATSGLLSLVRMIGRQEGAKATFTITRADDDDHLSTNVELPEGPRPLRVVNIASTHQISELLRSELEIAGRDHLYEDTLHEVLALLN
jgi:glucose-6-phosphate dehydrogenase assembly protein OpcA